MKNKIRSELIKYIEENIFPEYVKNDKGHNIEHIYYVIRRSLKFASKVKDINYEMVYTVSSYHDIGHHIDAKNHEKISAEILLNDKFLSQFFTQEQMQIMSEAIYDHRSSLKEEPRSIYGKIVSSADKNTSVDSVLKRTYSYRVVHNPSSTLDEIIADSKKHIIDKFGEKGYATEKIYFVDREYKLFLRDINELLKDDIKFKSEYYKANNIDNVLHNMIYLFEVLSKNNKEMSLDELINCVYIKLNTTLPFYEIKKQLLAYFNINEYEYYTKNVNKDLILYIESKIFPKYDLNDKAHGIVHIKEVIRRSFALNSTYKLNLNDNMIYAIAACHDINKYIDSDIHEKLAAQAFKEDKNMKKFFTKDEIKIISEAIEDHRSSKEDKPRSTYGKLISSADRNTTIEMVFKRSFFVALGNGKNSNRDRIIDDYLDYTLNRLSKRYSEEDPENMFYEDEIYKQFLIDMRKLLSQPKKFKEYYCEVNNIYDTKKLVKDYDDKKTLKL